MKSQWVISQQSSTLQQPVQQDLQLKATEKQLKKWESAPAHQPPLPRRQVQSVIRCFIRSSFFFFVLLPCSVLQYIVNPDILKSEYCIFVDITQP